MSTTLTFYTHPISRARVTRWMLEETGLPYEEVVLDIGTTMKSPQYLAVNPMGKVPAIRHGDTVVTESAAVCAYLAELAPQKRLAPLAGSPARGDYYRWLFFLAGPVESLMTARMAGGPLALARSAGYGEPEVLLDTLEKAVAGKTYLAGDHFTAADLYVSACLGYYLMTGALEKRPAFEAYVGQHVQRPAALAAAARDDALAATLASAAA